MKLSLSKNEAGQSLVEVALIVAVFAIIAILTFPLWGPSAARLGAADQTAKEIVSAVEGVSQAKLTPQDLKKNVPATWTIEHEGLILSGNCTPGTNGDTYHFSFRTPDSQWSNKYDFAVMNCKPPDSSVLAKIIKHWWIKDTKYGDWPEWIIKALTSFANAL